MAKIKLRKQFNTILHEKYKMGYGKSKIKGIHNETPYIHSESTYNTYKAQCNHFADYCYNQGCKYDMNEAFKLIPAYGKQLEAEGKSAWTIYTAINAIAKAYGVSTQELGYKPPKRERVSVKRSRYATARDKHFSKEANSDLITFCQCFGLRRRELEALAGDSMAFNKQGHLFIHISNGKGGKSRWVAFCGNKKEQKLCVELMQQASVGKVFSHIHSNADIHAYRAIYACRLYKSLARNVKVIPEADRYICRGDKKGVIYDKKAMEIVSRNLGHNRISIIASSYLHNL
ncbi:hypothetical protein [Terrisporobacter sp.]